MPIDVKKDIKPLLEIDWTRMDSSKAFFQKASGSYMDRYSIAVTTDALTTDGSDLRLEEIQSDAVPTGFENILEFYEKVDSDPSKVGAAFAEDWYLSERPLSKIKVLVSIPDFIIDNDLADQPPPVVLPTPWTEMYFNTFDFEN